MLCESAISREAATFMCYLVCASWSNIVNAMVWLVFVDNGFQMWLINVSKSTYCFGYLVIHTI